MQLSCLYGIHCIYQSQHIFSIITGRNFTAFEGEKTTFNRHVKIIWKVQLFLKTSKIVMIS